MSKLNIYKASAGSGKTFTLTLEYLKLLLADRFNFKKTLAVTFTNKAAGEMKTRVLREIHTLAVTDKLPEGERSAYLPELCALFGCTEKELQSQAELIQNTILHNYSHFNIETIDSFFQRVVQNFAKELGIYGGYSLELDTSAVIDKVVDLLFMELDTNTELKTWLTRFSEDRIDEGRSRNIAGDLKRIAQEIFKEDFTNIPAGVKDQYRDKAFLSGYFRTIREVVRQHELELRGLGSDALAMMDKYGLAVADFANGDKGFASVFVKAAEGTLSELGKRMTDANGNPDMWYSKSSKRRNDIEAVYHAGLGELLSRLVYRFEFGGQRAATAKLIYANAYSLGIISDIATRIGTYCEEEGMLLLSNNNKLLKQLIDDNDAPFIYEKIGGQVNNIMIDEFQDTSQMQWGNFRPLIGNCIAQGGASFVVGDVKQSIYRWRNGDWKILSEELYRHFPGQTNDCVLQHNWRSARRIIEFNNSFFAYATSICAAEMLSLMEGTAMPAEEARALSARLLDAYRNSYQIAPSRSEDSGLVEFVFDRCDDRQESEENAMLYTVQQIEAVQAAGFRARDIAILTRTNGQAGQVASFIQDYKSSGRAKDGVIYEIVSNEALLLSSASTVQFIISLLTYLSAPGQYVSLAAVKRFLASHLRNSAIGHKLFSTAPDEMIKLFIPRAHRLSLFELTERIIKDFELAQITSEIPFLQAFQDAVNNYIQSRNSSIAAFLQWWEEKGSRMCVSISDQQDAIKLMTVHKSKGLEFKAVIMPFGSTKIDSARGEIKWCAPISEPFNQLAVVPVVIGKEMSASEFAPYYFEEKLQKTLDAVNLLYVAFTRAEQMLFVYSRLSKPGPNSSAVSDTGRMMEAVLSQWQHFQPNNPEGHPLRGFDPLEESGDKLIFRAGSIPLAAPRKVSMQQSLNLNIYPSYEMGRKIVLATHGLDFFRDFDTTNANQQLGIALHSVFEHITDSSTVTSAVDRAIFEGRVSVRDRDKLIDSIKQSITSPPMDQWFRSGLSVKNEQALLLLDGKIKRPDRVILQDGKATVVDYKFTSERSPQHLEQIKSYVSILEQMGYQTEAYVWYVLKGEAVLCR